MQSPPSSASRPLPNIITEQRFSTKKEKGLTPKDRVPPRPVTTIRKCIISTRKESSIKFSYSSPKGKKRGPVFISFQNPNITISTPSYDEKRKQLYFNQCFEVVAKIGSGSFGNVYKVKSKEDGLLYAIKKSIHKFKGAGDRMEKLEEVHKHETLPSHRNCIKFIKAWEEKEHLYIQTELCKMSLSSYAEDHHNIAEFLIWNYLVDLLMAIDHLHSNNLIHLDIKPENIFVSDDDVCKLGDFGLVLNLLKDKKEPIEGDPKYLAPELLQGKFGKAADIFSLGISILELASDLDLPKGDLLWHELRSGHLPKELLKDKSSELFKIIKWMMQPDPSKRPTTQQLFHHPSVKEVWKTRLEEQMTNQSNKIIMTSKHFMTPPKTVPTKHTSSHFENEEDEEEYAAKSSNSPLQTCSLLTNDSDFSTPTSSHFENILDNSSSVDDLNLGKPQNLFQAFNEL